MKINKPLSLILIASTFSGCGWLGTKKASGRNPEEPPTRRVPQIAWLARGQAEGLGCDDVKDVVIDGSIMYAATFNAGLSVSTDGGASWRVIDKAKGIADNQVWSLHAKGNNIYIGSESGISISHNSGVSWDNHVGFLPGEGGYRFWSIAAENSAIYVASLSDGLFTSNDDGKTWSNVTTDQGLGSLYTNSVYADGDAVLVGTYAGLTTSRDGGKTWKNHKINGSSAQSPIVSASAKGPDILASDGNSLFFSVDEGTSWKKNEVKPGPGASHIRRVLMTTNIVYVGTDEGLWTSADRGLSWTKVTTNNGLPSNNVTSIFANDRMVSVGTDKGLAIGSISEN